MTAGGVRSKSLARLLDRTRHRRPIAAAEGGKFLDAFLGYLRIGADNENCSTREIHFSLATALDAVRLPAATASPAGSGRQRLPHSLFQFFHQKRLRQVWQAARLQKFERARAHRVPGDKQELMLHGASARTSAR